MRQLRVSRRAFLKGGLAGAVGAVLVPLGAAIAARKLGWWVKHNGTRPGKGPCFSWEIRGANGGLIALASDIDLTRLEPGQSNLAHDRLLRRLAAGGFRCRGYLEDYPVGPYPRLNGSRFFVTHVW